MRQDTRFLKILVSKNWVLYETWSKKLIRKLFETTIRKCINHANFLYCREETFKMVVHITKSRLPINSCYRFSFFPCTSTSRNDNFSFFFLFIGKGYVWMTRIKIVTKFRDVFRRFEENKNVINISSVKNWFKFLWALFWPFYFIKWQENDMVGPRCDSMATLSFCL